MSKDENKVVAFPIERRRTEMQFIEPFMDDISLFNQLVEERILILGKQPEHRGKSALEILDIAEGLVASEFYSADYQ